MAESHDRRHADGSADDGAWSGLGSPRRRCSAVGRRRRRTPARPPEVRAATPDLTIVRRARYDVQPDEQRVRVTVDLTLTNHLKDTTTKRYFFDQAFLAVLPGAAATGCSWAGNGKPDASASRSGPRPTRSCG